jgi:DMSO/TMAO reductase YedYZ molybdopterin-dependent catalytic subunit
MKIRTGFLWVLALGVLAGCTAPVSPPVASEVGSGVTPTPCVLEPIVVPTPPAQIPGYTDLDETTGLHVTGSIPNIDFDSYRLEIVGKVGKPLSLSYDDLRCMRKVELRCTLTCPGFFSDEATWAGVPLDDVLELAEIESGILGVKLVSADGYSTLVSPAMLQTSEPFLAYEWEGEPVPMLHGFPVRAIFPDAQGSFWAKWLVKIEVY